MKLFFTLDSLGTAGTEKSTLDILRRFQEIELKVIHLLPNFDLKSEYEKAGIPLHYIGAKGKKGFLYQTLSMIRLIRKEKPDLLISSLMRSNFVTRIAGILTATPVAGTFVSDSYNELRIDEIKKKKRYATFRFFWLLDRFTARIPAYWISNAASIAKSNSRALKIKRNKIRVIYRGRDKNLFPLWQEPDKKLFHFVFIGRLMELKGIPEMLEAVNIVKKDNPGMRLDVYGEGAFQAEAENIINQLRLQDTVTLHGKVPDGWKKLYFADCFLFPSRYEGFSGALVEAMMSGIPVIASDIPMNLEAASNKTALLFPVKNAVKLAECMTQMLNNYPAMIEMGRYGREVARQRFDIQNIAAEYEGFLQDVMTGSVEKEQLI